MGPEERRDHIDFGRLSRGRDGPQDLEFVVRPKSVSALGLHGRGPGRRHRPEPLRRVPGKVSFGGLPRRADRMEDPAPSGRDLRVAEALRLPLHLVLARTCEHGMGVGIDESRGDDLSRRLDPKIGARMPSEHLVRRPDVDDSRAFRVHGAILEDPQVLRRLTGARSLPAAKGEQFRRVHDQERRRRRRPFPEGGTDLVGAPLHPRLATPRESAWTTNAFPPAARIASAVLEGRSVSANMLPPPPAPVSLAP